MGNLEYSFDNILKSYIDTGVQLTDHQVNLISTNKKMVKTYIRKRAIALKKTDSKKDKILFSISDKELELLKKYDKKSYDDYINYLSNLEELDLSDNYLTSLPESIGKLTNLKELNLSYNLLRGLPESIRNLTNLVSFGLVANDLITIPDWIENLTNLKLLDLSGNKKLTSLPESIGKLTNLEWLRLDYLHSLTGLPESIGNLKNLENLYLGMNPISYEEKERIKKLLPFTDIKF